MPRGGVPLWQQRLLAAKTAAAAADSGADRVPDLELHAAESEAAEPEPGSQAQAVANATAARRGLAVGARLADLADTNDGALVSAQLARKLFEAPARASRGGAALEVTAQESRDVPIRTFTLPGPAGFPGVDVEIFHEDGGARPKSAVKAHVEGRLAATGVVFESTRAKGQPPMEMRLGKGEILPGMDLGLRMLTLGCRATLRIPQALGYAAHGIPRVIPPSSDLIFEVELLEADGIPATRAPPRPPPLRPAPASRERLELPWWLARVARPAPSSYYLSFCKHLAKCRAGARVDDLARAQQIPRKHWRDIRGWDLSAAASTGMVLSGVQDGWRAKTEWNLDWFRQEYGDERQLIKWLGPIYTKQETLSDTPIWESSVAEYVDYVHQLEAADPDCEERNAAECPRLYLNGWRIFQQSPRSREYVQNPDFIDDVSRDLKVEDELLRDTLLKAFMGNAAGQSDEQVKRQAEDSYWELTKVFICPKGAITRLHYDNGGAHVWLTQIRGRKLFICYEPKDTPHLHAFEGDEGLMNGSWIDPLASDVLERWPDYAKATPLVAVVEEGETIFAPQGWWHYAVALDTSVTVMRNFHSRTNAHELVDRENQKLVDATSTLLKAQAKKKGGAVKTDQEFSAAAQQCIDKVRDAVRQVC